MLYVSAPRLLTAVQRQKEVGTSEFRGTCVFLSLLSSQAGLLTQSV